MIGISKDAKSSKNISKPSSTVHKKRFIQHSQFEFIWGSQALFNICKSISGIHHINKRKDKKHMIISIMQKKHIKNSTTIHVKKNSPLSERGNIRSIIKAIYYKLATSYSMVKRKKLSYKFKNYTMPTLIVSTEHKIENAIHSTQTRKKK